MSFFFLDTSAVVKRYIQEHGSAWVQSLTNPANGRQWTACRSTS